MRRRTILLGLGAATGTGAAIGSGAFSTASADRQVNITVSDDANSFLALIPGEENGQFTDDSGDALVIDISGNDGVGVGVDTEYSFDAIVEITNNGQDPTFVWTTVGSAAFNDDQLSLYTDDPKTPLSDANAVELGAGESLSVGLYIDTTGLDSDEYAPTLTIEAADEDPNAEDPGEEPDPPADTIPSVLLDSVSSLLNENQEPLTDESIIPIQAEPTAVTSDEDGNGDAVSYPEDIEIPIVAVDGGVVGVTGPFVTTGINFFNFGNEEFLLNVYDQLLGGSGTVLHDEGHGQFYTLTPNGGDDFQAFGGYAANNGYTYEATDNFEADLSGADAVVITSPSDGFTESERDTLSGFVAGGGVVFLHDQSDFNNFDATANLNAIAETLGVGFRFNDDQVLDEQNNTGAPFVPTTANFNTDTFPALFADRDGLGIDLDPSETYEVDITEVTDGDTVNITFENGTVDTVRIVGIDTPETGGTDERIQEYEGIDDGPALKTQGDEAADYAVDQLADKTVSLSFDEGEGLRGNFGRLLGFLELSDGSVYNKQVIDAGEARVYDSGLDQHDEYWESEQTARANGKGIWEISDQAATDERRDDPVSELFFPEPVAVSGPEEPVASEAGDPLVAVDSDAGVAAVGGPLIGESFEAGEGGPGIADYAVFSFLTNVIDYVGDATGPVIVDGGHGQFAADFAVSAEDTAYYMRYLEGQSPGDEAFIDLEGVVDLATDPGPDLLAADGTPAARALILSTPTQALSSAEVTAVADFAAAGGAVILLGSAADTDALANFDPVVSELETNVSFTNTAVTDAQNNLNGDATVPTTTNFSGGSFSELFTAFTPDDTSSGGSLKFVEITADAGDGELEDPQENVVFENAGDSVLDLTGYTVTDETSDSTSFPDGFTLQPGDQVTLYSGTGTNTDSELYWGQTGSAIWNNGGDTVFVIDDTGTTVIEESYE